MARDRGPSSPQKLPATAVVVVIVDGGDNDQQRC